MDGSIFEHDKILGQFSRVRMGYSKNHNEIIKGSNCNQIRLLKESHQDLDTRTVR